MVPELYYLCHHRIPYPRFLQEKGKILFNFQIKSFDLNEIKFEMNIYKFIKLHVGFYIGFDFVANGTNNRKQIDM